MSSGSNESAEYGGTSRERMPYQQPRLGKVRLEADQVLGVGCKATYGAPASTSYCNTGPCNSKLSS